MTIISAKVIEDSISAQGARLTTMQLCYPRLVHSEFMTHRVFSRNASSSRAIPVKKMIQMVRDEPAMPVHWGANQPGMQAREELTGYALDAAKKIWLRAARNAANIAEEMMQIGLHKQVANRILEPFQHIHVVVTATDWQNFFDLRAHPDADPNIQALAVAMRDAMEASVPTYRPIDGTIREWHLPYITADERADSLLMTDPALLIKMSAARCARVSYLRHDGIVPSIEDDLDLYSKLVDSVPMHASPIEHQARPLVRGDWRSGNFVGWNQYRKLVEQGLSPFVALPALAA